MCDCNQTKEVLDLVNRVIDISEASIPLKIQNIQKEADLKIISIRNEWSKKYQNVYEDLHNTLVNSHDEDYINNMKEKYGIEQ